MLISELIETLKEIYEIGGDVNVLHNVHGILEPVESVLVRDEEGLPAAGVEFWETVVIV